MQLHQLQPTHKKSSGKRVGRGGKRGTYSGRGMKGQKSRAGKRLKPAIRYLIKRYPKLRGYSFGSQKEGAAVLNVEVLEKNFNTGDTLTKDLLLQKGLVRRIKGKMPQVKILGKGELTKALIVEGCSASKSAKAKIKKAGGRI